MIVWILPILFIIVCVSAIALLRRRESLAEICKRLFKVTKCVLSFSVVCIIGVIVFTSTFTYTSDYLNSVLSVEFITSVREMLHALFGTESVFASLQMLGAISFFLFSFVSCACCICVVCIFLMCATSQKECSVEGYEEKGEGLYAGVCVRRFALLSRYLI